MVAHYLDAVSPARPLKEGEILTHEGGIAHEVDIWKRLRRFLILGTEGWNFYTPQSELTIENVGVVRACATEDAARTIGEIVTISESGRAPKNEPAILALAMLTLDERDLARRLAFGNLSRVCRTGTHILHFAAYREALGGGWGRGMRTAVGKWFAEKSPKDLAYQAVKYSSRDGWALADLLRLSHPKMDEAHSAIAAYIVDGKNPYLTKDGSAADFAGEEWVKFIQSVIWLGIHTRTEEATTEEVARIIRDQRLPREAIPTEWLNDRNVWDALLWNMPMTAMIRNLGKMTSVGLITDWSNAEGKVVDALRSQDWLRKARVHPISILNALRVYEQGHGDKGSLTWSPSKRVLSALDEAFYLAFGNVESTGKRIRLALDVSGSMDGNKVLGMNLTAREASAAMALVTMAREPDAHIVAYSDELVGVTIRPSMRLDEVVRVLRAIPMGGTYCSLPIAQATRSGAKVDLFVSYTDNETWDGSGRGVSAYMSWMGTRGAPSMTASEELQQYRMHSGIDAKHAVVALSVNEFSIADPRDPGQLDLAGLDSATPQILADFANGKL